MGYLDMGAGGGGRGGGGGVFWLGDWMLSLGLSVSDIKILIKRLILLLFLGEFLD